MYAMQVTIAVVLGVGIGLFVPGLVWATVIAGLYQIAAKRSEGGILARGSGALGRTE